jgi:cytochrome o ubiquinol oxidase subunit 3
MFASFIFALVFATSWFMAQHHAGGPTGKDLFDLGDTFTETMVLLVSSITFGFATVAVGQGARPRVLAWLGVTFVLGISFVFLEIAEFRGMVAQDAGPQRSGFLTAFFTLVGTHGLHVSMGLVWIAIMSLQVVLKGLTAPVSSRLFRLGLFWHFLDIVWIGIFSIVYLPGVL